jgi:hypothetical protein
MRVAGPNFVSLLTSWLPAKRNVPPRFVDKGRKPDLDPELDGETEEFRALQEQIELERTTSLLDSRGKKRRRRSARHLDADAALAEAEKRQALLHSTSLLSKMPENDRFAPYRERKPVGVVLPLVIVLAIIGGGVYFFYPTVLPPEVKDVGHELEKQVSTAVQELPQAADGLLRRSD